MIKKIAVSLIFVSLIIAVFISVSSNGQIQYVELGSNFYAFMKSVALKSIEFDIEIPHIPTIPSAEELGVGSDVVVLLNAFFTFINFLVKVLNIIIDLLNTIIKIFEFIWFIISDFNTFKESLLQENSSALVGVFTHA